VSQRLLLNYATRKRKDKFLAHMNNIYATTRTNDFKIVVKVDEDDSDMVALIPEINRMRNTAGYIVKPFGKIAAINAYIPWYEPWDILVNTSDDFEFVPGWDEVLIHRTSGVWPRSTDWFAHFSDGHVKEKLPTMSIFGREYGERFGYVYHPSYKSVSCDAEAMYVAMTLGKYHYFPEVLAEHKHPVNVKHGYDEVYKANDKFADQDTAIYFKRMKANFYVHNPGNVCFEHHKR
jgi:hypothetical protein